MRTIAADFNNQDLGGCVRLHQRDTAGLAELPFYGNGQRVLLQDDDGNTCEGVLIPRWSISDYTQREAPTAWTVWLDRSTWRDGPEAAAEVTCGTLVL